MRQDEENTMDAVQAEREDRRLQIRLDKLLNRLPGLVYRCKIEENFALTLEYVSAGSESLLGIPAEEIIEDRKSVV